LEDRIQQKISYWIESADSDFEAAKILLENHKYMQSLFYCNLVIEKALKAYFWYSNQKEPPYTHNLIILASKCKINEIINQRQQETIDLLMPLNIKTRYPDEEKELLKVYTHEKTQEIYDKTEELYKWILQLLKK
jgi:HEPN domain-containing protein